MSDTGAADPAPSDRARYYGEAADWAASVYGSLRASHRLAWILAAVACGIAALEALALAAITPLRQLAPYVLKVDQTTGYMATVNGLRPGYLSRDPAVIESMLARYVVARESFDAAHLRDAYRDVMLWSTGQAKADYAQTFTGSNPASPVSLYGPKTLIAATLESVSLLSPNTALVRFDVLRRDAPGAAGAVRGWTALIGFRYADAPMPMADRLVDPLGFQVLSYQRTADMLTPSVSVPAVVPRR